MDLAPQLGGDQFATVSVAKGWSAATAGVRLCRRRLCAREQIDRSSSTVEGNLALIAVVTSPSSPGPAFDPAHHASM
ncbi:hypothetical protein [Pseudomonas sp. TH10]|uniref:hypothetical protein n=1 Tax=Pseudomonas sp. TH10 TaxID=2796376 RepID=UPI00191315CB|nr:hypothetical protein [Pseudomonas sp. TH10]MBK5518299.1 hypothetical protein [Pseudomonas sp. TH10]